jgi:putative hemolysin
LEQSAPNNALKISVRDVLKSKAPNTKVPRFLVKYLERIIHQDEMNGFLEEHGNLVGIEFIEETMRFLNIKVESEGLDELPDGNYTFAGNHPLGGIDGMATGLLVHYRFPEKSIKFLSNDILTNVINLLPLFIPVNKVGNQSQHRSLPKRINEAYQSENQMVIFPAGICSRRVKGEVTELEWQKSFLVKSIETKRDVVPVFFHGQNSNFFYSLANIRKFLGIKINIEMLYLVDEMFKQRGRTFKITYGKPIPYSTFDNSRSHMEWAEYVRVQTLALGKKK